MTVATKDAPTIRQSPIKRSQRPEIATAKADEAIGPTTWPMTSRLKVVSLLLGVSAPRSTPPQRWGAA